MSKSKRQPKPKQRKQLILPPFRKPDQSLRARNIAQLLPR